MGKQYLNGVLYGTGEIIKFSPYIYSLEEREIGVWTDGKPLYQKSFSLSNTTKNAEVNVDISSLSVETCVNIFGTYNRIANVSTPPIVIISMFNDVQLIAENYYSWVRYTSTINSITYYIGLPQSSDSTNKQFITIQYTKATDAPGSGKWTTIGASTVHYDDTERIIGTWFGETLYQKTVRYTATSRTDNTIDVSALSIDTMVDINCKFTSNGGTSFFGNVNDSTNSYHVIFSYSNGSIVLESNGTEWYPISYEFTLQYTKATT